MLKRVLDFLYPYRNYIRLTFLLIVVTTAADGFTFSVKKDPELLKVFNKNMGIISNYCDKSKYSLPKIHSITFGKMTEPEVVAYCSIKTNGFKLVFDKTFWDSLDNVGRTQLMFHEMAHCMFREEHSSDPTHFMYPSMIPIDPLSLSIQLHYYLSRRCKGGA